MSSDLHTPAPDLDQPSTKAEVYDEYEEYEDKGLTDESAYHEYRSLSIAAVAALIFGVLSSLLLPVVAIASVLLVVPVMGVLLGLFANR